MTKDVFSENADNNLKPAHEFIRLGKNFGGEPAALFLASSTRIDITRPGEIHDRCLNAFTKEELKGFYDNHKEASEDMKVGTDLERRQWDLNAEHYKKGLDALEANKNKPDAVVGNVPKHSQDI